MKRQEQSGFSLIGVMATASIMGFLAVVSMKLIKNSQMSQKTISNAVEFDVLKSSIKLVLDNDALCGSAFVTNGNSATFSNDPGPYPASSLQEIDIIKMGSAATSPVIAEKSKDLGSGLKIEKIGFRQLAPQASSSLIPGGYQYYVNLEVEVSKGKNTYGAKKLSNIRNPWRLLIHTDHLL